MGEPGRGVTDTPVADRIREDVGGVSNPMAVSKRPSAGTSDPGRVALRLQSPGWDG